MKFTDIPKKISTALVYGFAICLAGMFVSLSYAVIFSLLFLIDFLIFIPIVSLIVFPVATITLTIVFCGEEIFREKILGYPTALKFATAITLYLLYACYHNFKCATLSLANIFLTKLNFSPLPLGKMVSYFDIKKMIQIRNSKIEQIQARDQAEENYLKFFAETEDSIRLNSNEALLTRYQKAVKATTLQALEEYIQFLSEKTIDVADAYITDDLKKVNSLLKWYILRARNRNVTWTVSKEFSLTAIQDDADDLVAGLTKEQIAAFEAQPKWCCSISQGLMRTPVFVVLNNGDKRYYEYLNLMKWMSQTQKSESERDRLPENREKIKEIFFDLELQNEIESQLLLSKSKTRYYLRLASNNIAKLIYNTFYVLSLPFEIFKTLTAIPNVDSDNYTDIADPSINVKINEYDSLPSVEPATPIWKKIYEERPRATTSIEEYMDFLESKAQVLIKEKQGYIYDNDEMMMLPVYRRIRRIPIPAPVPAEFPFTARIFNFSPSQQHKQNHLL